MSLHVTCAPSYSIVAPISRLLFTQKRTVTLPTKIDICWMIRVYDFSWRRPMCVVAKVLSVWFLETRLSNICRTQLAAIEVNEFRGDQSNLHKPFHGQILRASLR